MPNEIAKYDPQLEVICKCEEIYYISAEKKTELLAALNSQHFVELNGVIKSRFEILTIRPAKQKSVLADFPPDIRAKVQERSKIWEENLNKKAPLEKQIEWAEKLQRGELII